MVEKAKQEVGSAKQEVGLNLKNDALQSETDNKLGPLGYTYSIHMPNMAEKAKHEVGSAKQEVGSYLKNSVSLSEMDENLAIDTHVNK